MPPAIKTTAAIDTKVARRQFLACTRALPMRASHSWRARRYGVSSGPSGCHWVVMRWGSPRDVGGWQGQDPAAGCAADGAGLPIELRTSDASAPASASALDGPPDTLPPPPGPRPKVEPTEALPPPADGPLRGRVAAARVAETLEATRPATVPAARPAAIGADAACTRWSTPRCGEPPSRLPAKLGAFQQRNMSAQTVRKTDHSSLKVISGPANRMLDRTGSMIAVTR